MCRQWSGHDICSKQKFQTECSYTTTRPTNTVTECSYTSTRPANTVTVEKSATNKQQNRNLAAQHATQCSTDRDAHGGDNYTPHAGDSAVFETVEDRKYVELASPGQRDDADGTEHRRDTDSLDHAD